MRLDLQLAEVGGEGSATGGATFSHYSHLLTQRSQLSTRLGTQLCQATMLEQLATYMSLTLPNPEQSEPLKAMRKEGSIARKIADEMVYYTQ